MTDESGGAGTDAAGLHARIAALEQAVARLEHRIVEVEGAPPGHTRAAPAPPPRVHVAPPPPPGASSDAGAPSPSPVATQPAKQGLFGKRAREVDLETLIAGRWLNRVGLLAVAVGVSYFLELAVDNEWVGPRGQVALGLLLGTALLASTSWFLKRGYSYFADGFGGLGAGVLYLSLWAGGQYYHLFSLTTTFGLMAVVSAGMMAIAVARNSQRLAVIALLGGFASPALSGSGQDAQVVLFGYLLILNGAMLSLAWLRKWRAIDLPAFVLTQIYFWSWFTSFYSADRRLSTAAFAILFFAMFTALPVIHAQDTGRSRWEHRLLVPLNGYLLLAVGFATLWPDQRWTLTIATLLLSAAHLAAARLVPAREGTSDAKVLFGGMALTTATMVIPIRLEGHWTTVAYSVEGAVLAWTGLRLRLWSMRVMAAVLLAVAGLQIMSLSGSLPTEPAVFNARFLTACTMLLSAGFSLWMARTHDSALSDIERLMYIVLAVVTNMLALLVLTAEVRVFFRPAEGSPDNALAQGLVISLLWALYASALMTVGMRKAIAAMRWQALVLYGLTIWKVFVYDMGALSGIYRVASSTALGVVLLIVSFLYQRSLRHAHENALPK